MITNNYRRDYESAGGLVTLEVIESDLSGVNVKMLVRYADNRPDKALAVQPDMSFQQTVDEFDKRFQFEVGRL